MSIRFFATAVTAGALVFLCPTAAGAAALPPPPAPIASALGTATFGLAVAHMSLSTYVTSSGPQPVLTIQSLDDLGILDYCVYPPDGPGSIPTCTGISGHLHVTGMVADGLDPASGDLCGYIGANPAPLPSQGFCTATTGAATFDGTDGTHLTFANCGGVTGLAGSEPALWYNNGPEWDGTGLCTANEGSDLATIQFGLFGVGTNLLRNPFVAIGLSDGGFEQDVVFLGL